ncbi:fructosamine kinase family protein [Piscibacillus salipiscarius]|uniref:Fructosamine kinase family protein n=1 Tax=Piscibacillus salipiscarius TaxID=299480 RepID=A0ABW5Q6V7_9BACI|nr:fructosamine kinase family protein [Piscibacillus salipiscarius]
MRDIIQMALHHAQDKSDIVSQQPVSGGSINESFFVRTARQTYFIKHHPNAPENFFAYEKEGLELIRSTQTIQVPKVYAHSDQPGRAYLVMEWVEGEKNSNTEYELGQGLAKLHQTNAARHGVHHDTYIGTLKQPNTLYNEWVDYYKECRLKTQLEIGVDLGSLTGRRREKLERIITDLNQFIPKEIKPTYLHGDLWGGNWLTGSNGKPYLIDPSFLYGDRHFDIAFTELFGGFSKKFYQAYQEIYPLSSYYDDIKELYQLYYLLVHLNIFGEMYGSAVDRVLDKYAG